VRAEHAIAVSSCTAALELALRAAAAARRDGPGPDRDTAAWAYMAAGTAAIVTYLITSSTVRYMLPVLVSASVVLDSRTSVGLGLLRYGWLQW
jgi:hypothetical protein